MLQLAEKQILGDFTVNLENINKREDQAKNAAAKRLQAKLHLRNELRTQRTTARMSMSASIPGMDTGRGERESEFLPPAAAFNPQLTTTQEGGRVNLPVQDDGDDLLPGAESVGTKKKKKKKKGEDDLKEKSKDYFDTLEKAMLTCEKEDGDNGSLKDLEKAIRKIEKHQYERFDLETFQTAEKLVANINSMIKLKKLVLDLNSSTIAELKGYKTPPDEVVDVMGASFVLLGSPPSEVSTWDAIRTQLSKLGKESIMRRLSEFRLANVTDIMASKADELLGRIEDESEIEAKCGDACGAFYGWSQGMLAQRKAKKN